MTREQEIVVFHYTLGVAITQWSNIETLLANIVFCFYGNDSMQRKALAVGFFSIEGFRLKLQFADGLVSRVLTGTAHKPDWNILVDRMRTLSTSRNKLAHWQISKFWQCKSGQRVVLCPWLIKKTKKKTKVPRPPAGSLNISEIYKLSLSFASLAKSLENFLNRICRQSEPHPASALQPGDPLKSDDLERQIREVFSVPQKSSPPRPES